MIDWKPIESVPRGTVLLHASCGYIYTWDNEDDIPDGITHWAPFEPPKMEPKDTDGFDVLVRSSTHGVQSVRVLLRNGRDAIQLDRENWELLKAEGDRVFDEG